MEAGEVARLFFCESGREFLLSADDPNSSLRDEIGDGVVESRFDASHLFLELVPGFGRFLIYFGDYKGVLGR